MIRELFDSGGFGFDMGRLMMGWMGDINWIWEGWARIWTWERDLEAGFRLGETYMANM